MPWRAGPSPRIPPCPARDAPHGRSSPGPALTEPSAARPVPPSPVARRPAVEPSGTTKMFSALKKLVGSEQPPGRDKNIPAGLQSMNQALQRRFAKGVQYNSESGAGGAGAEPRPSVCPSVRCPGTGQDRGMEVEMEMETLSLCVAVPLPVFPNAKFAIKC